MPSSRARLAVAVVLTTALAACAGEGGPASRTSPATTAPTVPAVLASPGDIDPALLQPLTALGPCELSPNAIEPEPVAGLVLPPDAIVTSQSTDGPLVTVEGYVPMTPVQIRVLYQRDTELDIIQVEDEIRESETLVDTGEHRLFVKAQAVCEQGSVFVAIVAPEAAEGQVPAPAGGAGG